MQDDISGWNEWEAAFKDIPELASPSELHGLVMGIISITQAPTKDEWQIILQQLQVEPLPEQALQLLTDEAEDAAAALEDDTLDYMPMLPDDQHLLEERVQCLADWCNGVVLGFGLVSGHLREGETELLQDLQDVAAVEFESSDDDEEGEASYADLVEFVRLIPVSLALGRKKQAVSATPILKQANGTGARLNLSPDSASASIVEMFTPDRPS